MDPRVEQYKNAFCRQYGEGANIPVFSGSHRYQYGQGVGDVLRGIWRFFRPVAIKGAQTLLKAGSEAIKDGATVKDVLKSTIKPTIGALLGATAEQMANRLSDEKSMAAPPPGPALEATLPPAPQTGSGKRKRKRTPSVYKARGGRSFSSTYRNNRGPKPIRYNF